MCTMWMLWKQITLGYTTCTKSCETLDDSQAESDRKNSVGISLKMGVTCDRDEKDGNDQHTSYLKDLNWLGERKLFVAVRDCHIQEVDNDHEDEEDADVEDYDVDVPLEPLEPVDYSEGAQELCKIGYDFFGFPDINHLFTTINTRESYRFIERVGQQLNVLDYQDDHKLPV